MEKKIIWHGSTEIIQKPIYGFGKVYNDYGLGFYCTESEELAKEWACQIPGRDGYANAYQIDANGLEILSLSSPEYTILNWLALLVKNRDFRNSTAVAKQGKEYLLSNFLPDVEKYDIIIGYRADDSYFSFARSFVNNEISLEQLSHAMKLGKLGEQFVLKSERAFLAVEYLRFAIADSSEYYSKRKKRNDDATEEFRKEQMIDDINGIYMRDIIRERIDNHDPRIR